MRRPHGSTLFPYTTLFRSKRVAENPSDPDATWVDDKRTHETETLPDLVTRAFQKTFFTLVSDQGGDQSEKSFLKGDRKSTRLNSSHVSISYAVFCLKKKTY